MMHKQPTRDEAPTAWLWRELERRLGAAATAELRDGYATRSQQLMQHTQHTPFYEEVEVITAALLSAREYGDTQTAQVLQQELVQRQVPRAAAAVPRATPKHRDDDHDAWVAALAARLAHRQNLSLDQAYDHVAQLLTAARREYRAAGASHGDDGAGLQRWIAESQAAPA
jgi:hypothetical protein